jgi:hypothetical protein
MNQENLESQVGKLDNMNGTQLRNQLGFPDSEATRNTYMYLDKRGEFGAVEKADRTATPSDEYKGYGYLGSYQEWDFLKFRK